MVSAMASTTGRHSGLGRIALVTDAWEPQVNGVVRTLTQTTRILRDRGHEVMLVTPGDFKTIPCPSYPEIRLALFPRKEVACRLTRFHPDAIHIATEGPLGMAARHYCLKHGFDFTTSFHTRFAEYLRLRVPVPTNVTYALLRRFHSAAARTLVPTPSQRDSLVSHGFRNLDVWSRGVDTEIFNPTDPLWFDLPRPLAIYMGRVSVEKNINAFLDLKLPGSKMVIGDGPDLGRLKQRYPDCHFPGPRFGRELARHLAAGDVFVFPSRTDTFGLVLLEAMACGLPVATFPVQGPLDVVAQGVSGWMDEDLGTAVLMALELPRTGCIAQAQRCSWEACTNDFVNALVPLSADQAVRRA
jgi:glycosyltransferase involved in cell wall biosynthesis